MKKIISAIILVSVLLLGLCACADTVKYENVTYRENGIEFFLPSSMRRESVDGYDFYFSNLAASIIFTAVKVDEELLRDLDIDGPVNDEEYVNILIERNKLDKEKMYYNYDEVRGHYNFRYSYEDADGFATFYYIVVIGDESNLWYIEMCCKNEDSNTHLETFKTWKRNIKVYS